MNLEIAPASVYDAIDLAPRLRPEDVREVGALGLSPLEALVAGVGRGPCFVAYEKDTGKPLVMYGAADMQDPDLSIGGVWLMGAPEMFSGPAKIWFLRHSKNVLSELERGFDLLFNIADPRNTKHIAWLRWLGFTFLNYKFSYGRNGETFVEFVKLCAPLGSPM